MRPRSLRRHLSFANVCSGLALFLTLSGGVAWAAVQLGPNSVRAKHIGAKQIRAKHLAPKSIKAKHLSKQLTGKKGTAGIRGPRGPEGPRGAKGEPGAAGAKGTADGVLMGPGPLSRHAATPSPYPEIALGSVKEFSVYGTCVDGSFPSARVFVRTSVGGSIILGGTGNAGGAKLTVPNTFQISNLETQQNPSIPMRFGQYAATLISVTGEIYDVRGIAYVQRAEAMFPIFPAGRACGFNQASILKASR